MTVEERVPERVGEEGKYVYCIIECDEPRSFGRMGIGGRNDDVYSIQYGGLSAVVSDTPVVVYDPTRENALTHEHVIELVLKEFTVIPMSFGAIFRTEDDVIEFLKDTSDALRDVLVKMKDRIEFGLKVNWDPETVLKQVEEETEDIRRLKEEILSNKATSTYFARMQLGRMIERAMSEASDTYVRVIYDHLRDCAIASRHNKPIGDKMILNAAFLVERDKAAEFDHKVGEIAQQYEGRLRFQYTGPWPPYNFVNIHVKLEQAGVKL
jgi:hypothetical protein